MERRDQSTKQSICLSVSACETGLLGPSGTKEAPPHPRGPLERLALPLLHFYAVLYLASSCVIFISIKKRKSKSLGILFNDPILFQQRHVAKHLAIFLNFIPRLHPFLQRNKAVGPSSDSNFLCRTLKSHYSVFLFRPGMKFLGKGHGSF